MRERKREIYKLQAKCCGVTMMLWGVKVLRIDEPLSDKLELTLGKRNSMCVCVCVCVSTIEIQTIGLISMKFGTFVDHDLGNGFHIFFVIWPPAGLLRPENIS
jgi:hypothetical protein